MMEVKYRVYTIITSIMEVKYRVYTVLVSMMEMKYSTIRASMMEVKYRVYAAGAMRTVFTAIPHALLMAYFSNGHS